jgi:G3E family GTPase
MNDFGPVSVDTLLVAQPDLPLEQIGGGCICCSDEQSLGDAITTLANSGRVRAIVVETSGLADPAATIELLSDPALMGRTQLRGVATVVDAEAVARPRLEGGEPALWSAQVRFANWLLLSKCDLIAPSEVRRVETVLRKLNPQARILRLPECTPEPTLFFGTGNGHAGLPGNTARRRRRGVRHLHHAYQTTGFQFTRAAHGPAFTEFLNGLDPAEVVRAKGFVRLRGCGRQIFSFHYVQGRHCVEPYEGTARPKTVAVFIGPRLNPDKYLEQLESVFEPPRPVSRSPRKSRP